MFRQLADFNICKFSLFYNFAVVGEEGGHYQDAHDGETCRLCRAFGDNARPEPEHQRNRNTGDVRETADVSRPRNTVERGALEKTHRERTQSTPRVS